VKENKVVRKIIRKGHSGGHHGGSWKVAYADFVTAMMAFFLLMWLLTMVSAEKRIKLANYFKNFSLFEQGGTPIDTYDNVSSSFSIIDRSSQNSANEAHGYVKKPPEEATIEQIQERLEKAVKTRLGELKDQVLIDSFKGGVRIQVVDKEGKPMFLLGSAELTDNAKKALSVIAENIKNLGNKMAIGGHTDALSYSGNRYTNWELSTERASAAREFLENNGVETKRLIMVAGYADVEPLIREDPYDPRNRRISILLFDNPTTQSSADKPLSMEKKLVAPLIDASVSAAATAKKPENPVPSKFQN
jgi:chemotaxis protein MotB